MKVNYFISVLSLFLSSCALSEGLSPSKDGKMVTVSVVKPTDVDILPMNVIYRSKKCTDKIFTSEGEITNQYGFNRITVPFIQDAGEDTVSNKIALSGGGSCDWQLSNIRFQFKYSDSGEFSKDIKKNIPADIVFMFDDNVPPRGDGNYEDVYNDIVIAKDYYPIITKRRLYEKTIVLRIKGKDMPTYRVHNPGVILFKPDVHSSKVITVLGPEKFGGDSIITYPDGSVVTDTEEPDYPNFEKLKMMK